MIYHLLWTVTSDDAQSKDDLLTIKPKKIIRAIPGIAYMIGLLSLSATFFRLFVQVVLTGDFLGISEEVPSLFIDFRKYYAISHLVLTPLREKVYDPITQMNTLSHFTKAKLGFSYSEYPPFFFAMVAPFTILPIDLSYLVWCFDGIVLSGIALFFLTKTVCRLSWQQWAILFICMLSAAPGIQTLALGQSSYFLLPVVAFFCWAVIRRIDNLSGAAIAISTIKPQYIPFLCIIPAATGRWWMLFIAAIVEFALILLAASTIGWRNIMIYPKVISALDSGKIQSPLFVEYLVSIRQPLKALPYPAPMIVCIAALLVGGGLLFYLWRRSSRSKAIVPAAYTAAYGDQNHLVERWLLASTISSALALSLHTHLHDCVLLAIVAVMTLPTFSLFKVFTIKPLLLKIWTIGFLLYPLLGMLNFVYLDFNPDLKYGLFLSFNLFACVMSLCLSMQLLKNIEPEPVPDLQTKKMAKKKKAGRR